MRQFKALISDLDGTLVDTEPVHAQAWFTVLARYGLHFDHNWFLQFVGTSDFFVAQEVIQHHGVSREIRELQDEKQLAFHALVRSSGSLIFKGLEPILARISAHYPTAIATNSGRLDAEEIFAGSGLPNYFPVSVTASDVARMKPDPAMYLLAAQKINVSPLEVLVCEDSPAGIAGAKAAGCYVIGITNSQSTERLAEADEIVTDSVSAFERIQTLLGIA